MKKLLFILMVCVMFVPLLNANDKSSSLLPPKDFSASPGDGVVSMFWNPTGTVGEALNEGFEYFFPPIGWAVISHDGGTGWTQVASGTSPMPGWQYGTAIAAPDGGNAMAYCTWTTGGQISNDQWLVTRLLTVEVGHVLSFYMRYWPNYYDDNVDIRISTTTQTDVNAFDIIVDEISFSVSSSTDWQYYSYNLTEYVAAGTSVYIAFREHVSNNHYEGATITLDNVNVGPAASCSVSQPGSLSQSYGSPDSNSFKNERYDQESPGYISTKDGNQRKRTLLGYNIYRNGSMINLALITGNEYYDHNVENGTTYTYYATAVYAEGESAPSQSSTVTPSQDANIQQELIDTAETKLQKNYPNPFNPETSIDFYLKNPELVIIEIFNIRGQKIKTLVNSKMSAGNHNVIWNGLNDRGEKMPSGVYFYRMRTDDYKAARRMILIK
jgi:hypothetical protein